MPEGGGVSYTYDARGNVTETRQRSKTPGTPADIVTSAVYMEGPTVANCANPRTCNQPASTTDARGNTTDYTYNSTHGGVLTVTAPDPDGAGPAARPQTRITYAQRNAWHRTSSSLTLAQGSAIWLPTETSACATGASCAGQAQEVRTIIAYEQGSASVRSNLLPVSASTVAGDSSLTVTTTMTYDIFGNQLTVDGPLAGSADTTRVRYDALRRTIGVIGPDPDGGGPLKHRTTRISYHAYGMVNSIEQGTVNSQSDSDWATFSRLEHRTSTLHAQTGRKTRDDYFIGGVRQSVAQYSYDAAGRLDCAAMRMNPAAFGSLPASACTASAPGAYGPDRIAKNGYNIRGQLTQVIRAFGTAEARTETLGYTPNGLVDWVEDGNGNRSDYEYDGHDRLYRLYFPQPAVGAHAANTSDYEQCGYDPNGNVTSLRLRSGDMIANTYDALNRLTFVNMPGSTPDVTRSYDNLSRLTSVSISGHPVSFAYDSLNRMTSETTPLGATSYQYDPAGRRTRTTWPGTPSFYVSYDYDVTGAVTAIRENGTTSGAGVLATYTYDNLGRRKTMARGNGVTTTFTYDTNSQDWSIAHDLNQTVHDLTLNLNPNPAGQIVDRIPSNAAYAWAPSSSGTTNYTHNGLNQMTIAGALTLTHDNRGNITSDGQTAYEHDRFGRLKTAGTMTLTYDPLNRLYQTGGTATTRFAYDGVSIIAEYNGSNGLLRRYVHGPGIDEPIVWYEGSGTSDRRWLLNDERGSIIAVMNGSGAANAINFFDPYGQPGASNQGRFQYTGQAWLPEVGIYHYKARAYHPGIGRFLQTDPMATPSG